MPSDLWPLLSLLLSFFIFCEAVDVEVRVIVLRSPDGSTDDSSPYYNPTLGTLPLESDGNVNLNVANPTLATSITQSDVAEIFQEVNRFYAPAGVIWKPTVVFAKPTVSCGSDRLVCGRFKCRSHDYFVKYWGTINKSISKDGREERAVNFLSLVPEDHFVAGKFHVLFSKYIGISSQGVVVGSAGDSWLRNGRGDISVANVGQWSDKFTSRPVKRPNVVPCNGQSNCGLGLAYTTAHELGHLFNLGHTDAGSIMSGGGAGPTSFSAAQVQGIQSWLRSNNGPKLISSFYGRSVNLPSLTSLPSNSRDNVICSVADPPVVSPTAPTDSTDPSNPPTVVDNVDTLDDPLNQDAMYLAGGSILGCLLVIAGGMMVCSRGKRRRSPSSAERDAKLPSNGPQARYIDL